jgi:hypothetical protein
MANYLLGLATGITLMILAIWLEEKFNNREITYIRHVRIGRYWHDPIAAWRKRK